MKGTLRFLLVMAAVAALALSAWSGVRALSGPGGLRVPLFSGLVISADASETPEATEATEPPEATEATEPPEATEAPDVEETDTPDVEETPEPEATESPEATEPPDVENDDDQGQDEPPDVNQNDNEAPDTETDNGDGFVPGILIAAYNLTAAHEGVFFSLVPVLSIAAV